ncbi:MAG: hypothetical protein GVY13_19805 [Alphaproteobacteria bacterium]|jgi:hypothetical protein|nr:hypothetical protein [Alphaproteobacteria bacterium]
MTALDPETLSLRQLLDPVTPEAFFAEHYGRSALFIPGERDKFANLFSWTELNTLLDMTSLWTAASLEVAMDGRNVPARDYCYPGQTREGLQAMRPDPARVQALIAEGASLNVDYLDTMGPGLRAVAEAIEMATGAPVTCNAFCSWDERPGYGPHFDTLQVFALQIEGEKTWSLFDGFVQGAAELPGFSARDRSPEEHDRAKGGVVEQVTLRPGDILYVPQGQYHQALASQEGSLHLSFGARHFTGADLVNLLLKEVPKHPAFREALPHFDEPARHQAHLARLAGLLREFVASPQASTMMRDFQRERACERLPRIRVPGRKPVRHYRVRTLGAGFEPVGGGWRLSLPGRDPAAVPADLVPLVSWVLECDHLSADTLREAFPDIDDRTFAEALRHVETLGLIHPL